MWLGTSPTSMFCDTINLAFSSGTLKETCCFCWASAVLSGNPMAKQSSAAVTNVDRVFMVVPPSANFTGHPLALQLHQFSKPPNCPDFRNWPIATDDGLTTNVAFGALRTWTDFR